MGGERTEIVSDADRAPLRLPAIVSTAREMIESGGIESNCRAITPRSESSGTP